jgi:hypothetical protein
MSIEELLNILILVYFDPTVVSIINFHAKKLSCNSQILHLKTFAEVPLNRVDLVLVLTSNDEIINVQGYVNLFSLLVLMRVGLTCGMGPG